MQELNDNNFETFINKGKFLLLFYTDWCSLCPPLIDLLTQLEESENSQFQFAAIHYDYNKAAVQSYGIIGVPTVLVIYDGKPLYGCAGLLDISVYKMMAEELLYNYEPEELDNKIKKINEYQDEIMY